VSETPIMDAVDAKCDELGVMDAICYAICEGQKLELALNEANERIKRLEDAGDTIMKSLSCGCPHGHSVFHCQTCTNSCDEWRKDKDAKP